jgi:hypothetical protein
MASGHLCALEGYLRKNEAGIINYREWRDAGRRISTSAVEGTVNRLIGRRMCKSQHMCWTKRGAHLLLQVRCAVFNGDLLAGFQRWFPAVGSSRIMLPWYWLPQQQKRFQSTAAPQFIDAVKKYKISRLIGRERLDAAINYPIVRPIHEPTVHLVRTIRREH